MDTPAPPGDKPGVSFVSLIRQSWRPSSDDDHDHDDVYEALEGCTERDGGWMRISHYYLMVTWYRLVRL